MSEQREAQQQFNTRFDFPTILKDVTNFVGIQRAIGEAVNVMRQRGVRRVGFVSGPIANTSETNPKLKQYWIDEHMERMRDCTQKLRDEHGIPIFSSTDIFDVVWKQLEETKLLGEEKSSAMKALFRGILRNCGVTDIFMMEGWRDSPGAVDEYNTAQEIELGIHDLDQKESSE